MTEVLTRASDRLPTSTWHRVCSLADLEILWGEAALIDSRQVALFRLSATEVRATSHRDPLTGACVMARGIVGSRDVRDTVASPLHKQVYDLATGECLTDPALRLPTYATRVVEDQLEVALPHRWEGASTPETAHFA